MTFKLTLGAVFVLMTTISSVDASDPEHVVVREVAFNGCHFKLNDPYNGTLEPTQRSTPTLANYNAIIDPKTQHPFETWIQFSCKNPATPKTYLDRAGMRMTSDGWALDPSPDNVGPQEQRTTFYPLHGKGWEGGGVTQDDVNGEEERRTRSFSFCIPHNQLALCGSMPSVAYLMWPKESVLPQIIRLLESIEFIDTPPITTNGTHSATSR
jgi:hypothetical protein